MKRQVNQSQNLAGGSSESLSPTQEQGAAANEVIDLEFTVKLVIKNAIDREALNGHYGGNLLEYVRQLTTDEGLLGCVEDDYEILFVKEVSPTTEVAWKEPIPSPESEEVLQRRRALMPDYDRKLRDWLS